jgi:hypothetical protein
VRRVRGCLTAAREPVPSGSRRRRLRASLGTPSGSLRPCSGPLGRLAAPLDGVFRSGAPFQTGGRSKGVTVGGRPGTPGSRPHQHAASLPVRRLLATPVAASGRPVAGKERALKHTPGRAGISAAAERCAHGESHHRTSNPPTRHPRSRGLPPRLSGIQPQGRRVHLRSARGNDSHGGVRQSPAPPGRAPCRRECPAPAQ